MKHLFLLLILFSTVFASYAQENQPAPVAPAKETPPPPGTLTNAMVNAANNPLARNNSFAFQNYYMPSLNGIPGASSNSFMVRPVVVMPFMIFRATIPFNTIPATPYADPISGLSDINMFATFLLTRSTSKVQFGLGPQLSFPTASNPQLGTEKWQAGLAAVMVKLGETYLIGGLLTWQMSYAGTSTRSDCNQLNFQPFYVFQIGKGFTLKGTAVWTFDFVNGTYYIPFGLGVGKVMLINKAVVSIGLEPQYTFLHNGLGQPVFQLFAGLSIQFPQK